MFRSVVCKPCIQYVDFFSDKGGSIRGIRDVPTKQWNKLNNKNYKLKRTLLRGMTGISDRNGGNSMESSIVLLGNK